MQQGWDWQVTKGSPTKCNEYHFLKGMKQLYKHNLQNRTIFKRQVQICAYDNDTKMQSLHDLMCTDYLCKETYRTLTTDCLREGTISGGQRWTEICICHLHFEGHSKFWFMCIYKGFKFFLFYGPEDGMQSLVESKHSTTEMYILAQYKAFFKKATYYQYSGSQDPDI